MIFLSIITTIGGLLLFCGICVCEDKLDKILAVLESRRTPTQPTEGEEK